MISLTNDVYINVPGRSFPDAETQQKWIPEVPKLAALGDPPMLANSYWIPCCQVGIEVNHG
jgi:hypothetical protein